MRVCQNTLRHLICIYLLYSIFRILPFCLRMLRFLRVRTGTNVCRTNLQLYRVVSFSLILLQISLNISWARPAFCRLGAALSPASNVHTALTVAVFVMAVVLGPRC